MWLCVARRRPAGLRVGVLQRLLWGAWAGLCLTLRWSSLFGGVASTADMGCEALGRISKRGVSRCTQAGAVAIGAAGHSMTPHFVYVHVCYCG